MEKSEQILNEFDKTERLCNEFKDKMYGLICELLDTQNIKVHQITHRVKDRDKLEKKIKRKEVKYEKLDEITDIVGLRIITYFEDEVDKIAGVIEKEFTIDKLNTIDKRKLESDRFGYKSLHYVVSLSETRTKLTENKKFGNKKCEIQIRSILQHAWAEIEHDIGYLDEIGIPEFAKRNFSRIAALLETADLDFVRLRDVLTKYEDEVNEKIKSDPSKVLIDKPSLIAFVNSNTTLLKMDQIIIENFGFKYENLHEPSDNNLNLNLNKFNYFGIKNIKEIEELIVKNKEKIIQFSKLWIKEFDEDIVKNINFPKGLTIFYLFLILLDKKNDLNLINEYYQRFNNEYNKELIDKMIKQFNDVRAKL